MIENVLVKIEESKWEELRTAGKLVNGLDDLRRIFPAGEKYSEVIEITHVKNGHDSYLRPAKQDRTLSRLVGYRCHHCDKSVIGMPDIKPKEKGFEAYCRSCNKLMYSG